MLCNTLYYSWMKNNKIINMLVSFCAFYWSLNVPRLGQGRNSKRHNMKIGFWTIYFPLIHKNASDKMRSSNFDSLHTGLPTHCIKIRLYIFKNQYFQAYILKWQLPSNIRCTMCNISEPWLQLRSLVIRKRCHHEFFF